MSQLGIHNANRNLQVGTDNSVTAADDGNILSTDIAANVEKRTGLDQTKKMQRRIPRRSASVFTPNDSKGNVVLKV